MSKKLIALCLSIISAIAVVITGIIFGVVGEQNTSSTVEVVSSDIVASQTSSPSYFASPSDGSLVIVGTAKNGNTEHDTTGEVKSGSDSVSVSYYQGYDFVSEIYDKRTYVEPVVDGTNSFYYLTSKIATVSVYYQMGAGTKGGSNYVFVLKVTYNLDILKDTGTGNQKAIEYNVTSCTAEYLALTPDTNGVPQLNENTIALKSSTEGLTYNSSSINYWGGWNANHGFTVGYKAKKDASSGGTNDLTLGTDIKLELSLNPTDSSVIVSSQDNNKVGVKVTAENLKSNIWIRANFQAVTHTDTFKGYVVDADCTKKPGEEGFDCSENDDYTLNNAGTIKVEYYKNGETQVGSNYTDINDDNLFNSINERYKEAIENGSDNKGLSSNDVAKVTVTPKEGYYISDVILKYNGQNFHLLSNGDIELTTDYLYDKWNRNVLELGTYKLFNKVHYYEKVVETIYHYNSETKLKYTANLNYLAGLVNILGNNSLNLCVANSLTTFFSENNGEFSFYYSGAFSDIEINIVYKSETFIFLDNIDSFIDERTTKELPTDKTIANSDILWSDTLGLFKLFVDNIVLNDDTTNPYFSSSTTTSDNLYFINNDEYNNVVTEKKDNHMDIMPIRVSTKEYYNNKISLAIKVPGASKVQVTMQNAANKTAKIEQVLNKANQNNDITSQCNVSGNKDSMSYNALTTNNSVININTINERKFNYAAYIGVGGGNYRLDYGSNDVDSNYIFNHADYSTYGGMWSDLTITNHEYMGAADAYVWDDLYRATAAQVSSSFYGNEFVVTMKNVNGYKNRQVVLTKTNDVNNTSKYPGTSNILAAINSATTSPVTITNYGSYTATINGDDELVVTFTFDDLDNNDFYIKTYYDAYSYTIKYNDNNGDTSGRESDGTIKTEIQYFNVKPSIETNAFNATKTGYTLMGFTQGQKFENGVSDGDTKPSMYYVSSTDDAMLCKYDNGSSTDTTFVNYVKKTAVASDIFYDCYGWLWYGYSNANYKLQKNLIQTAQGSDVYSSDNDTSDENNVNFDGATVKLYAVWHANNYQVTYNASPYGTSSDYTLDTDFDGVYNNETLSTIGGNFSFTTQLNYDHAINTNFINGSNSQLPNATRTGYIFLGWSYKNFYLKYDESVTGNLDLTKIKVYEGANISTTITKDNYQTFIVNDNSVLNGDFYSVATINDNNEHKPKYDKTSTIDINKVNATKGSITLYAIWKPIVYTITVDSLKSGANVSQDTYKDYETRSITDSTFDLNDLYNNNGSSPAIVYNNNTFNVQFDGTFKYLSGITTTRVGYDFDGWKHFDNNGTIVSKINYDNDSTNDTNSIVANTVLSHTLYKNLYLRSKLISIYEGSDKYNASKSNPTDAWVQLVPTWTAQKFTIYYSVANHTLRGYKLNRGSQTINGVPTPVYDDITFKIGGCDMNFEGTYEGTSDTYKIQEIYFDTAFNLLVFESNAYNLDGWYYYYDGVSEPTSNSPFTSGGALESSISSYKDGFTATGNYSNNYIGGAAATETFNFSRYLFNARWANYDTCQDDEGNFYNNEVNFYKNGNLITADGKSYGSLKAINGLVSGNSLSGNDYYQSLTEANRKFTIFSDLSPKDISFNIDNSYDREDNIKVMTNDDGTYISGGYVDIYEKQYEYNTSTKEIGFKGFEFKDFINKNPSNILGLVSKSYVDAIENDYQLIFTPDTGRYLKTLTIQYSSGYIEYNFEWNSITKTVSIIGVTIDSIDEGQENYRWDNIKATLMGKGAYYVEDSSYGKTVDIYGVYGEHYNHKVNNGGTLVYDTNPIIIDIIFPKNVVGQAITIKPTWAVQTYDIELYTLKVKDTNQFNVVDGNDGKVGNNNNPDITETMGYLTGLYQDWNGNLSVDVAKGYERIPAYKLKDVPYGYELVAEYIDAVGVANTKFNAYKAEFSADGNTFIGYKPTSHEYPIWERHYFPGYRFYDNFEYFTGYTKNDFIYESATNRNEIFFPTPGYKFLGAPNGSQNTYYTYNYKENDTSNTYYTIRNLATRTSGTAQYRDISERKQTIFDSSVFFSVYVQTPKQEVKFHVFNPETKLYEVINTGEDYVLSYWENGAYVKMQSDLVDGEKGIVNGMPSRNIGYWPEWIDFNGYIVGPNLKQLYGYSPETNEILHNTDYVGKFFTKTFVELVNYHGDVYDDNSMYDITGLFDKFDKTYMIDHEIHVYAVYDYQQFNIDNDYGSDDAVIDNSSKWITPNGNTFTIGNNGDFIVENEIKFGGTTYTIKTNINLSRARTSDDGSIIKTFALGDIRTLIMNQNQYMTYLSNLKSGATRETALLNTGVGPLNTVFEVNSTQDKYLYVFYYLFDTDNDCYLIADNMIRIDVSSSTLDGSKFSSQSTLIGVKIKSYNVTNNSYTLELGGYYKDSTTNTEMILKPEQVKQLWLNQAQFETFVEATYDGKLLIDALRAADRTGLASNGETKQSDDEYMFLFVKTTSNASIAMASTNFVRIKDGEALIYDSTDFFDVITYVDSASDKKSVNVIYEGNTETINANFSISVVTPNYETGEYIYYGIENVAFVLLDELGFAEYQRLIDSGEIPENALLQAAIFNNTNSFGNKTYVIPCLTDTGYIDSGNKLIVEENTPIHAVSSTIMKYSGSVVWEIKSNGFRIVAARVSEHENPDYFKNESNDFFNTYYKDVNGDIVFEGGSPKMNNNVFSYHINCIPSGANTSGYTVLGQTRYNEYIKLINSGKSIEQALVTASDNNLQLRDTEGDNSSTHTKGMKYIFVWFNATEATGQSAEQIIVSSSIIVFNPEREMVTIKPAYNYFDISACFAKNVGDYIRPGTYDVKLGFDKDNNSIVTDSTADHNIYFTLNLGYGTSTKAYTKDDIKYTVLNNAQKAKYDKLIESGETMYSALNKILTEAEYEGLKTTGNGEDFYIFLHLGELSANTVFASHVININTNLGYAVLVY